MKKAFAHQSPPPTHPTLRRLLPLVVRNRLLLAVLMATAVLLVATESLGLGTVLFVLGAKQTAAALPDIPFLTGAVRSVSELAATARLQIAALILVAFTLLRGGLQYIQQLASLRLLRKVEVELQERIFAKFHLLSLDRLNKEHRGSLMALPGYYTWQTGRLVLQSGQTVANAVVLGGYLALALLLSWRLALLSLALVLPAALLLRPMISRRLREAGQKTGELAREVQSTIQEHLAAMKLIRLYAKEEWSRAVFKGKLDAYQFREYRSAALIHVARPLLNLFNVLLLSVVLLVGPVLLPTPPEALLVHMALFLLIAFRLMGPVGSFAQLHAQFVRTAPMIRSIFDLLDESSSLAPAGGNVPFRKLRRGIELESATFRYAPGDPPVLRDVTLSIPAGLTTAVVGPSGAGKSSLVNLVTGLYEPSAGTVRVDGVDLRELELDDWRRRIAVVSQEVLLFHASVRENLRFARPEATDEEIVRACRLAQAHDFVSALPQGYDTVLQEGGARLSGGQRQRIALARALLMDADLLILDEATSELDGPTELAAHAALARRYAGRTVLVVAHRMSVVRSADRILVIEGGRLVEQGKHPRLMEGCGAYARLARAQGGWEKSSNG